MKLVCPHDRALIARLEGRTICARVHAPSDIAAAAADVRRRNTLACVICDATTPLEDIELQENWRGIPIALVVPAAGRFRTIAKKLATLRSLDLRVHLPCDALTEARILASLGIPVCIGFDTAPDWDALTDLMTYALLGVVQHAAIEPFRTIAEGYRQTGRSPDWGHVLFDDPSRYLHLDPEGRIALSRRELLAGEFVASDLSALDSPALRRAVEQRSDAWRVMFADDHFCARCQAWRICRARFCGGKTAPDGCQEFFDEMAQVIERRRSKPGRPAWQP